MSGKGGDVKRTYGDPNAPGGVTLNIQKMKEQGRYDDHSHVHRERERKQKLEEEKKKNPSSGRGNSTVASTSKSK